MNLVEGVAVFLGGGGVATIITAWLSNRSATHATNRTVDAKLAEHWTGTTLELVERMQSLLNAALAELEPLRPLKAQLEEALDHLHHLIEAAKSEDAAELKAALRRASAYLRRMRPSPDEAKGEQRQGVQRKISAKRIERDADEGKID